MTGRAWIAIGGLSALCVALAAGLAIALASDGDGDPDELAPGRPQLAAPGGPGIPVPSAEDRARFEDCLADQGLAPPRPETLPRRKPRRSFRRLEQGLRECAELMPQGFGPGAVERVPFGPPG